MIFTPYVWNSACFRRPLSLMSASLATSRGASAAPGYAGEKNGGGSAARPPRPRKKEGYLTTCDVATSVSQAADFLGLRS